MGWSQSQNPTECFNEYLSLQINDLNQVPVPVMLLPDDFKANTKIKVNNHLFNK